MFRRYSRGLVRIALSAAAVSLLWPAVPGAQEPSLPSAREVIDRNIQASGGLAAFKAVTSIRGRGSMALPSQNLSGEFEMLAARPNKMLIRGTIAGIGRFEEAFDGKTAWSIDPLTGPSLATGRELVETADDSLFDAPLHAPDHVREMTVTGREQWESRTVYRVKVVLRSGTEQSELFDVETGLQAGAEAVRHTPIGAIPTLTVFRDYQKYGALTLPSKAVLRAMGIEQVLTFSSYEFDVVPANAFDMPPAIKALIK